MTELTKELASSLIDYDPDTGAFTWKVERGAARAGSAAGACDHYGYLCIKIHKKNYKAHRLAWLLVHGEWPKSQLDHINGIPGDNRIANLRPATNAENCQNRALQRNNRSGYPGVGWDKSMGKWRARIQAHGISRLIGYFDHVDKAVAARKAAKATAHEFQPTDRNAINELGAAAQPFTET